MRKPTFNADAHGQVRKFVLVKNRSPMHLIVFWMKTLELIRDDLKSHRARARALQDTTYCILHTVCHRL